MLIKILKKIKDWWFKFKLRRVCFNCGKTATVMAWDKEGRVLEVHCLCGSLFIGDYK